MGVSIDADFPSGSIELVRAGDAGAIEVALRDDNAADIRQWFDFRIEAEPGEEREVRIVNAGESSFPNGWVDYAVMGSGDGQRWGRVATSLEDGVLTFLHQGRASVTEYAYFTPYTVARSQRALRALRSCPWARVRSIGRSAHDRPLSLVTFGDEDDSRLSFWVIARQHPGESPASFAAEGLMRRLSDETSEITRELLSLSTIHVVPMMNPDGVELGNTRTSATGVNLNRVWDDPRRDASPEVLATLSALEGRRVDLFLDLHADESAPFAFATSSEGNPSFDDHIARSEAALRDDLAELVGEFLDEPFYGLDAPGGADLSCASNQIGERFLCPALTLELPVKECTDGRVAPGWSARRARELGSALAPVMLRVAGRLSRSRPRS